MLSRLNLLFPLLHPSPPHPLLGVERDGRALLHLTVCRVEQRLHCAARGGRGESSLLPRESSRALQWRTLRPGLRNHGDPLHPCADLCLRCHHLLHDPIPMDSCQVLVVHPLHVSLLPLLHLLRHGYHRGDAQQADLNRGYQLHLLSVEPAVRVSRATTSEFIKSHSHNTCVVVDMIVHPIFLPYSLTYPAQPVQQIPEWWRWFSRINPVFYTLYGLVESQVSLSSGSLASVCRMRLGNYQPLFTHTCLAVMFLHTCYVF